MHSHTLQIGRVLNLQPPQLRGLASLQHWPSLFQSAMSLHNALRLRCITSCYGWPELTCPGPYTLRWREVVKNSCVFEKQPLFAGISGMAMLESFEGKCERVQEQTAPASARQKFSYLFTGLFLFSTLTPRLETVSFYCMKSSFSVWFLWKLWACCILWTRGDQRFSMVLSTIQE